MAERKTRLRKKRSAEANKKKSVEEGISNDTFCSLDMLAEVASATLKSDPTFVSSRKGKCQKSKVKSGNTSRKHASSSEKLTLDQIKALSDKMLIDMFSELICDEIRKNYSFQCFLMPDKCSQIFKSFGSEARARCKMRAHLQSHISELLSQEKGKANIQFSAEPLHVRRKRLKELNAKSLRKRKRGKLPYTKKKKDLSSVEDFPDEDIKNVKPRKTISSSCKNSKDSVCTLPSMMHKNNCDNDFEKSTSTQFNQDPECASNQLLPLSPEEATRNMEQITLENYCENGSQPEASFMGYKVYPKRKKRYKGSNTTHSEYIVKWNVDFEDGSLDNSSFLDFDVPENDSEAYLSFHHDHVYTSVLGKTYDLSSDDYKNTITIRKDIDQTHKYANMEHPPMIIPTPPFPYVYIPILPQIAEIQEVGKKAFCHECVFDDDVEHYCENSLITLPPYKEPIEEEVYLDDERPLFCENDDCMDDDENNASDSYLEGSDFSDSDTRMREPEFILEHVLETDCSDDLQSLESEQ